VKIVVVGAGHVGATIIACLLSQGHEIVGVEADAVRRADLARGQTPLREPRIAEMLAAGHAAGRLSVSDRIAALAEAAIVLVCVGTPGLANGSLDLSDVRSVAGALGDAVRRRPSGLPPLLFVFHTTLPPGATAGTAVSAIAAAAGEAPGERYEVVYCPVFFREGSAVADYLAPPRIVIGERVPGAARHLLGLCDGIDAPIFFTSFETAELAKLADNALHALKVGFANEIGRYAARLGVEPSTVSQILLADGRPGQPSYLRPGAPFGGPCLPKDTHALSQAMREAGVAAPLIAGVLDSNAEHLRFLLDEIGRRAPPAARLLLVGLTFKDDTDDIRASPSVDLAEALLERRYRLAIHDPDLAERPDRMSEALAATVVPRSAATDRVWGLVILAKPLLGFRERLDPRSAVFDIYRL
jgi:GDP-mannose 6-dehydrogenase